MKRVLTVILSICAALAFTSCSAGGSNSSENTGNSNINTSSTPRQSESSSSEQSNSESETPTQPNTENKILIAYFTWADNTKVEDPSSVDVDASTSASVLAPGNAAKIASWIAARTGGDLFSIIVEEPYSSDYDQCLDRAADEKAANARPILVSHVENIEQYDTVFLGFPNWWYTVPMAIHSFLEEYDFSGKTIEPLLPMEQADWQARL